MSKQGYVGINNTAKKISNLYIGDNNNKAKKIIRAWVGDEQGKARQWWGDMYSPPSMELLQPVPYTVVVNPGGNYTNASNRYTCKIEYLYGTYYATIDIESESTDSRYNYITIFSLVNNTVSIVASAYISDIISDARQFVDPDESDELFLNYYHTYAVYGHNNFIYLVITHKTSYGNNSNRYTPIIIKMGIVGNNLVVDTAALLYDDNSLILTSGTLIKIGKMDNKVVFVTSYSSYNVVIYAVDLSDFSANGLYLSDLYTNDDIDLLASNSSVLAPIYPLVVSSPYIDNFFACSLYISNTRKLLVWDGDSLFVIPNSGQCFNAYPNTDNTINVCTVSDSFSFSCYSYDKSTNTKNTLYTGTGPTYNKSTTTGWYKGSLSKDLVFRELNLFICSKDCSNVSNSTKSLTRTWTDNGLTISIENNTLQIWDYTETKILGILAMTDSSNNFMNGLVIIEPVLDNGSLSISRPDITLV